MNDDDVHGVAEAIIEMKKELRKLRKVATAARLLIDTWAETHGAPRELIGNVDIALREAGR
jgi:hypothetical protein